MYQFYYSFISRPLKFDNFIFFCSSTMYLFYHYDKYKDSYHRIGQNKLCNQTHIVEHMNICGFYFNVYARTNLARI